MTELTHPLTPARTLTLSRSRLLTLGGLALIILLNVWGALHWIETNVLPVGRDAGGHLTRALQYHEVLREITPQTLFQAVTFHGFRPPALYLATQIPYRLLGTTMDAAQMVNVAFLVAILGLTFVMARRITTSDRAALLATLLTGLFPMMAAMSRLFYLENFLTAAILATLLALLLCQGFASRRWALAWGAAAGVGMLVKWSFPAHVLLPILVVLWRGGLLGAQWAALRHPQVDGRALGAAIGGALLLVALLYLPNRAHALTLPLGDGLALVWLALLVPLLYSLARPSRPLPNFWAGTLLALFLMSFWYAARIDFLDQLVNTAVGDYDGRYEGNFDPFVLNNYTRYPRYLVTHHLGLLGGLALLPALFWPWLRRWRAWRSARLGAWLLWGSLLSTYLALAFTWEDGKRNLVPILPLLAILAADSLWRYRRPALRWALGLSWIAIFGLQWALVTFDGLAEFHARTAPLWPRGDFLVRPASGQTDPGYWIAPDVLATVAASHDPANGPQTILGMLVNSIEVHRGPFNYLIRSEYPHLDLIALTERDPDTWARTVRSEWVLSKDGDNHDVDPPGLRAIAQVYAQPPGLWPRLFREVKRYPLPNGETAILWRREVGPPYLPEAPEALKPLGETLAQWLDGQPLVLTNREQALDIGLLNLTPAHVVLPGEPLPDAPTIFTLLHRGAAADEAQQAPLRTGYYPAFDGWFDSEFLAIWGRPTSPMVAMPTQRRFGGATLAEVVTVREVAPGNVVPLDLAWEEIGTQPLKASLRLLGPDGAPIAQIDRDLLPTMRLGLFVPPATPPGSYTVALGLYDPATLQPVAGEGGEPFEPIATVTVTTAP